MKPEDVTMLKLHALTAGYRWAVSAAVAVIDTSMSQDVRWCIAWSGGKDSTVMLHLILSRYPDTTVYHRDSGYSLPGTMDYLDQIQSLMGFKARIVMAVVDYIELCQEFGFPHQRTDNVQKKIVTMLKKKTGLSWARQNGFSGIFLGLRAEESRGRKWVARTGDIKLSSSLSLLSRSYPVIKWSARDIWAYHVQHGMAGNPCYDNENCGQTRFSIRNAGWLSTDGERHGWMEWIRHNYPAKYRQLRDLLILNERA